MNPLAHRDATTLAGGWTRAFPHYSVDQLFGLIADIESYPSFIPGCVATRVLDRDGDRWRVDNLVRFGPLRSRFVSLAEFDAPSRLVISSDNGPWRDFRLAWRLSPSHRGSRLACSFAAAFRSRMVATVARLGLPDIERATIAAFEHRAQALYAATAAAGNTVAANIPPSYCGAPP